MKQIIYEYLGKYPPALDLFRKLEMYGNFYLIGGVLREFKDHQCIRDLRDIDIVMDTSEKEKCKNMLKKYQPQINSFGGYKIFTPNLIVDIWFLDETWAYWKKIVDCPPEKYGEKLTDTVFLNIDGIAYDWKHEKWNAERYNEAMNSRVIDIVLDQNPQIKLNIIRAMVLRKRYDFAFSERMKAVIVEQIKVSDDLQQELFQIQHKRYNKDVLSLQEIGEELNRIL